MPQPSDQPSFGSEFERPTLADLIARAIERGASSEEIARIADAYYAASSDRPTEQAAQCPKCKERTGFRVARSTWLDSGKSRDRICLACKHFFRTFETFPKE